MRESFWQKENFLQYTMTLLQCPKDPVLPILDCKYRVIDFCSLDIQCIALHVCTVLQKCVFLFCTSHIHGNLCYVHDSAKCTFKGNLM